MNGAVKLSLLAIGLAPVGGTVLFIWGSSVIAWLVRGFEAPSRESLIDTPLFMSMFAYIGLAPAIALVFVAHWLKLTHWSVYLVIGALSGALTSYLFTLRAEPPIATESLAMMAGWGACCGLPL